MKSGEARGVISPLPASLLVSSTDVPGRPEIDDPLQRNHATRSAELN